MPVRDQNFASFGVRVNEIERSHAKARRRALARIDRSERLPGAWFPASKILTVVVIGLILKAIFMANVSEGAYTGHLLQLENGNLLERASAVLLAPDPLSKSLAQYFEL